jgi:hypothetical protein
MHVELRTPGLRLARAQGQRLTRRAENAFARLAHRVVRVVLRVLPGVGVRDPRECVVEVHMADGHVEQVHERRRRLHEVVVRAIGRAREMAIRRLAVQAEQRPRLQLSPPRGDRA